MLTIVIIIQVTAIKTYVLPTITTTTFVNGSDNDKHKDNDDSENDDNNNDNKSIDNNNIIHTPQKTQKR